MSKEQRKSFLKQVKKNTPNENFYLYQNSDKAKKEFKQIGKYCNCSRHSRSRSPYTKCMKYKYKHGSIVEEDFEESSNDYTAYKKQKTKRRKSKAPCRKTCSTVHHPMFHYGRCGGQVLRPKSADVVKDHNRVTSKEMDWTKTDILEIIENYDKYNEELKDIKEEASESFLTTEKMEESKKGENPNERSMMMESAMDLSVLGSQKNSIFNENLRKSFINIKEKHNDMQKIFR